MTEVYLSYNNIVSGYGLDSLQAVDPIERGDSALRTVEDTQILSQPFCTSRVEQEGLEARFQSLGPKKAQTLLEKIMIVSLADTLSQANLELSNRIGLIISTTKGNIDVLEANSEFDVKRAYLPALGREIKDFFGFTEDPIVLSNACVSGVLALAVAKRLILQDRYDHVFVVGGDLVTRFILSGFNALQALSDVPCRPYCSTRTGINIGEVGASVLVTRNASRLVDESVVLVGESSCNDANHISGPSRTGEGLYRSILAALRQAGLKPEDIDYVSAHGTATPFNDEMESIAFHRAGLDHTPLNSLKGYFGHTLGASGLVETVVGMHSLHRNKLFASKGFQKMGVSHPLGIIEEPTTKHLKTFLKTASGFGGCNTSAIFQKVG